MTPCSTSISAARTSCVQPFAFLSRRTFAAKALAATESRAGNLFSNPDRAIGTRSGNRLILVYVIYHIFTRRIVGSGGFFTEITMNLFEVEGTVTTLGQCVFDNSGMIYAYIAITDASGRRTMIEKVAVSNDIGAVLAVGQTGRFYVDRLFSGNNTFRCQLWGVRADGHAVIARDDLRSKIGWWRIGFGILTVPVFGIGLLLIFSGIGLLMGDTDRQKLFRGRDCASPPPLPTQAVRI